MTVSYYFHTVVMLIFQDVTNGWTWLDGKGMSPRSYTITDSNHLNFIFHTFG